ncbi:hypothetical protein A3H26_00765 [candidate division WWE3 bacterium RIFCSPLOWO2_12_FULL_36_10]|uniref:Pilus assembly protein PilO n=1 Tax=candidate division WWE3 bacterium RIFCSPLOWO2_12_FULL_36_10 TaxID=1802630 RepID=A0A1F4VKX2_UNCKA|nr:MAG: hypothetical protein A3H26_00765 [candidate division WWE3 bacterium RIFCSPLOWO2_12_FULL_36_10]
MKFNFNAVKQFFLNFLIPIISLGITGVLFVLVIYPSLIKLPVLNKEVQSKVKLKDQLDTKLKNLNSILDFKSVVDENSSLVSQAISSATNAPQLLTQIDTIAKDSGLTVLRLSYSFGEVAVAVDEKGAEKTNDVVIVNLGAQGTYLQVKNFAQNLENSSRLINIKDFRFSLDNETKQLDVVFVLESPYQFVNSTAVTDDPVNIDITKDDFVTIINKVKGLKYYNISIENISQQAQKAAEVKESTESTP